MTSSPPMNYSEPWNSTSPMTHAAATVTKGVEHSTLLPTQADTTMVNVLTTAVPAHTDSTVIAVVIILVLLTVAGLAFLLYRYLCHNKGDYRTTGEPAPGEDPDEDYTEQITDKKEYFI